MRVISELGGIAISMNFIQNMHILPLPHPVSSLTLASINGVSQLYSGAGCAERERERGGRARQ